MKFVFLFFAFFISQVCFSFSQVLTLNWPGGNPKYSGEWKGEQRIGKHKWYYENGEKKAEVNFDQNGKPLNAYSWNNAGEIMEDIGYKYEKNILGEFSKFRFDSTLSGLKYHIESEGTGPGPIKGQKVLTHYIGTLTDGSVFEDGSGGRPFKFKFSNHEVIPGFDEAVGLLKSGGIIWVKIPHQLAYGNSFVGNIPPESVLVYKIELVGIE